MPTFVSRPFGRENADAAAQLLAERHARHRLAMPALDPRFEDPAPCRERIAALLEQDAASGGIALDGRRIAAFVLGVHRDDDIWGPNVWMEDAGSAGDDAEAIRAAYAGAAGRWVEEGRTSHFTVVPASDEVAIEAWFSLGFGQQQVHAMREPPAPDFAPRTGPGLTLRRPARADLPALAELDLVLPRHQAGTAVFSPLAIPSFEETLAELTADFDDPRYAVFVAEHDGRVVGTAVGCSLELSSGHTQLMRPRSCGFLGFAAVLPDARGLGAGRALADAVMAWSRDEGYEWVATDWRSTNLEANRSWRARGFRPTFMRLHRAIV